MHEFELIFNKSLIGDLKEPKSGSLLSGSSKPFDEGKSMMNRDETPKIENYYLKFEALKVSVIPVNFKSSKSFMIKFNLITDLKAKNRLIGIHSRLIANIIINN